MQPEDHLIALRRLSQFSGQTTGFPTIILLHLLFIYILISSRDQRGVQNESNTHLPSAFVKLVARRFRITYANCGKELLYLNYSNYANQATACLLLPRDLYLRVCIISQRSIYLSRGYLRKLRTIGNLYGESLRSTTLKQTASE